MVSLPLKQVPIVDYGPNQAQMERYRAAGIERALALGNRGPIRFDASGSLHPSIAEAYSRCGFYVFEAVLERDELADIERDLADILERLPVTRNAKLDRKGRPALGSDCEACDCTMRAAPVFSAANCTTTGTTSNFAPTCGRTLDT